MATDCAKAAIGASSVSHSEDQCDPWKYSKFKLAMCLQNYLTLDFNTIVAM